MKIDKVVTIF